MLRMRQTQQHAWGEQKPIALLAGWYASKQKTSLHLQHQYGMPHAAGSTPSLQGATYAVARNEECMGVAFGASPLRT